MAAGWTRWCGWSSPPTGPDGQKVGPVQLEPRPEGQGFYSSGPVLSAGTWKVTVNSPAPLQGRATATVQAKAAQLASAGRWPARGSRWPRGGRGRPDAGPAAGLGGLTGGTRPGRC